MAASATPKPADTPTVAVAYSGGPDSTALLWATARAAMGSPLRVLALHVHHGLMSEGDAWVAHAEGVVAALATQGFPVRLEVARLSGEPMSGDSVEAWARQGRYRALAEMARAGGASLILLGQHADDQAETVLLQALRGAGPAGLAAMPSSWEAEGLQWARPWLHRPGSAVRALAHASGLPAVQDPSNDDPRFARSRLRARVWPALVADFPQTARVLSDVAAHAAHARTLADEVAALDLPSAMNTEGELVHGRWMALTPARRRNVMAAWLAARLRHGVPNSLLARLCTQWQQKGRQWPAPGGLLRSVKGCLRYEPSSGAN